MRRFSKQSEGLTSCLSSESTPEQSAQSDSDSDSDNGDMGNYVNVLEATVTD